MSPQYETTQDACPTCGETGHMIAYPMPGLRAFLCPNRPANTAPTLHQRTPAAGRAAATEATEPPARHPSNPLSSEPNGASDVVA